MTKNNENKIASREESTDDSDKVVNIKIDEKNPTPVKRMTKAEAQVILDKYKEQCKKFPARLEKFKQKEEGLKKWVASFK